MIFPWTKLEVPSALPSRMFPNKVGEFTWEDFWEQTKGKYPIRFWWQQTVPKTARHYWRYVTEASYWLRTHSYNRYHILDLRCPTWGLEYKWGWYDRAEFILIAPFQLLKAFVEDELPHDNINWDYDDTHREVMKEIKELYAWWMTGRKKDWDDFHKRGDKFETVEAKCSEEYHTYLREIDVLEEKDDEMLRRLIKIRGFLWV